MCPAHNANASIPGPRVDSAEPAHKRNTEATPSTVPSTTRESSPITPEPLSENCGSSVGDPKLDDLSRQNFTSSGPLSNASTRRFKHPKTVKEFANQASVVCTMLLNGKIDLETARAYSGIARVVAQAISSEVTKSRFLKQKPEMTLDDDVFDASEEEEAK